MLTSLRKADFRFSHLMTDVSRYNPRVAQTLSLMSTDQQTDISSLSPARPFVLLLVMAALILLICGAFAWYVLWHGSLLMGNTAVLQNASNLGQSFGVLGTIFTGLAFAAGGTALVLQNADVKSSLIELRRSVEVQTQTAQAAQEEQEAHRLALEAGLLAQTEQSFISLERSLRDTPAAFRFHQVDMNAVERAGVTPDEFSYLVAVFTSGGLHIKANDVLQKGRTVPAAFKQGSYFRRLLSTPEVLTVWPELEKMIGSSVFLVRLRMTIDEIRAQQEGGRDGTA